MYFVYLLKCKDGSIYTGITTDVKRRIKEHKSGKGAHYTAWKGVSKLLYTEEQPDRSSATKREAAIKRWPRKKKLQLARV
jgi:putative endonuclease